MTQTIIENLRRTFAKRFRFENERDLGLREIMKVVRALIGGFIFSILVEIFLRVSPHTSLPAILDWIVAPGFLPLMLFYPCGNPPEVIEAFRREWLLIGYIINFLLYSILIYGILWIRENRKLKLK